MAPPAPLAKAAILAQIAAHAPLASVTTYWGEPIRESDLRNEMIYLGDVEVPEDNWSEIGARRRRTEFTITFTIAVRSDHDDEQTVETLAWTNYDEFIAALRLDYTLGGAVRQLEAITARQTNQPLGPHQQWFTTVIGTVQCFSSAY